MIHYLPAFRFFGLIDFFISLKKKRNNTGNYFIFI